MRSPSISPLTRPASFSTFRCWETVACASGQLVDDLAAVAGVAGEQQPEDADAGGVAERLREQRELGVALLARDRWVRSSDGHATPGGVMPAAAAIPAGTPRSGFMLGICVAQA